MKILFNTIKLTLLFFLVCVKSEDAFCQSNTEKFIQLVGSEPSVEINLGSAMLGLLASATDEEKDISSLLSALKGIKVTVFDIEKQVDTGKIRSEIRLLGESKTASGFQKLASVSEDDSLVQIFAHMDDKGLNSLSVFALDDDDELVLIDIEGTIDISQIGKLMQHFDVDLGINGTKIQKNNEKDK